MKEPATSAFVSYLEALRDRKDRAALAKLRRGLGKKVPPATMYPYVVPFLPVDGRDHQSYFLVGALFALHPEAGPRGATFGAAFRRVWTESDRSDSVAKRFTGLLAADADDVGGHLRHAVSLAKSRGVPVDYHRLHRDLHYWDHPKRFVQLDWARDFWRTAREGSNGNESKGDQA